MIDIDCQPIPSRLRLPAAVELQSASHPELFGLLARQVAVAAKVDGSPKTLFSSTVEVPFHPDQRTETFF
ncbi:MAG: hypothetical protein AB8B91_04935 [Rubripirellula sp.]